MKKIILVQGQGFVVLTDYINTLNIFDKIIHLNEFSIDKFINSVNIYVFTQMWLDLTLFPESLYTSDRFIFLNIEMLTEQNRWNNVYHLIKKNIRIADYSLANIKFIKDGIKTLNITYPHEIIHLPYQYSIKETVLLENIDNEYIYDIGIINAFPKKDSSVNSSLVYRRSEIFEKIQATDFKCVNIVGWGEDRDNLIRQCKIIINIHHFSIYNIFEHIRCDRLVFANKIVVSDKSLYMEDLDIYNFIIWKDYDDIIGYSKHILNNFEIYQKHTEKMYKKDLIMDRIQLLKDNYEIIIK